ncbi:MAG: PASTA domain-containing protein [Gammaproteobacteria bacterium]|nr:PASTA domain-containing protein [Gammaproteobacteria bacterium]
MSGIFISYRRSDSAGHTGRLFDRLRATFGERRVFIDVCDIDAGSDFARTIERRIGACDVLLAIIGREWLDSRNAGGGRRLEEAGDFVRQEIAAALRRGLVVIPVLVEQARMPAAAELPAALRELAGRNAFALRDERWDGDVEQLIGQIRKQIPSRRLLGWRLARWTPRIARLAYATALGLALVFSARLAWQRWWPSGIAEVPDIARLEIGAARSVLERAGLRLGAQDHEYRQGVRADLVIGQDPDPGLVVKRGRAVDVVLASAAGEVPALSGRTREDAAALLQEQGLTLGRVAERETSQVPPGQVLAQSPPPGTVPAGRGPYAVDIVIAKAPPGPLPIGAFGSGPIREAPPVEERPAPAGPSIRVPDVSGLSLEAAKAVIAEAGLTLGAVRRQQLTEAAPGSVLSQSPLAGSEAARGARIDLAVAQRDEAADLVHVRRVVGMEVGSAKEALARQGLVASAAIGAAPAGAAPGTVLSQSPAPGRAVHRGATIALLYAPEAPAAAVPALVGLTLAAAERRILDAGMTPGERFYRAVDDRPEGTVIAQDPLPGAAAVRPGAPIALTVARRGPELPPPPPSRGTLTLRLGAAADIDAGRMTASGADDLAYKPAGGGGPYVSGTNLEPVNGAAYAVVGVADAERCRQATYSTQARSAANLVRKQLCLRTNEGSYVAITVDRLVSGAAETLEISFSRL